MINRHIKWYPMQRDSLVTALARPNTSHFQGQVGYESPIPGISEVYLGIEMHPTNDDEASMRCVAIDDHRVQELLAWVHTFAPQFWPLSTHCRVLTFSEYAKTNAHAFRDKSGRQLQIWASIVLGELLIQREPQRKIVDIPLSWVTACSSAVIARAALCYGPASKLVELCGERIEQIQRDTRFGGISASNVGLERVWASAARIVDGRANAIENSSDFVKSMPHIAASFLDGLPEADSVFTYLTSVDFSSDSVEKRLHSFDKLVARMEPNRSNIGDDVRGIVVAAGAFLVGRGTSHISLIDQLPWKRGSVYAWFALIAGISGDRFWDPLWFQFVRRISTQLGGRPTLAGISICDLFWTEFDWLRLAYSAPNAFESLPKLHNRGLIIEIIPGANYHARLAGGSSPRDTSYPGDLSKEMEFLFTRLRSTTAELEKKVMGRRERNLETDQPQLPLGESPPRAGIFKNRKPRRG